MIQWDKQGACRIHAPNQHAAAHIAERLSAATHQALLPTVTFSSPLSAAWSVAQHADRVARIRAWIAAGDCYQANLTVPFTATMQAGKHRDLALFQTLMLGSPAPFAGFFRCPNRPSLISHSPECFLAQRGDRVVSVPIKGTRRRQLGEDEKNRHALAQAPKDAAELAMIVDLVRNDLGRVAIPGSVQVTDRGHGIDLAYVHHRAARIEAQLRADQQLFDVVRAAFPAGSITGAPKLRAMQLLDELEGAARGAYCGAFGWVNNHSADLAVAIRTASMHGDQLHYQAGGGIVWDSEAQAEWDEVQAKAAGFAQAIGAWA
jgi:para-aminobenzoate synthetase component 1